MNAQTVKGIVTDENGQGLAFSNVVNKATSSGVTTDAKGNFEIKVNGFPATLIAKYVGYQNKSIEVTSATEVIVFKMEASNSLDEVVVTGNRSKVRSVLNSAVPIDKLYSEDLKSTGQVTFDKMLGNRRWRDLSRQAVQYSTPKSPSEHRTKPGTRTILLSYR